MNIIGVVFQRQLLLLLVLLLLLNSQEHSCRTHSIMITNIVDNMFHRQKATKQLRWRHCTPWNQHQNEAQRPREISRQPQWFPTQANLFRLKPPVRHEKGWTRNNVASTLPSPKRECAVYSTPPVIFFYIQHWIQKKITENICSSCLRCMHFAIPIDSCVLGTREVMEI